MYLRKRSGKREQIDVNKIKAVVAMATNSLDVNPLELESRVSTVFREGVSTREIQDNLINQALTLTSVQEPDWRYVAGRLLMMDYHKDIKVKRNGCV